MSLQAYVTFTKSICGHLYISSSHIVLFCFVGSWKGFFLLKSSVIVNRVTHCPVDGIWVFTFFTCCAAFCKLSNGSEERFKKRRSLFSRGGGSFLRCGDGAWYKSFWKTRDRAARTACE